MYFSSSKIFSSWYWFYFFTYTILCNTKNDERFGVIPFSTTLLILIIFIFLSDSVFNTYVFCLCTKDASIFYSRKTLNHCILSFIFRYGLKVRSNKGLYFFYYITLRSALNRARLIMHTTVGVGMREPETKRQRRLRLSFVRSEWTIEFVALK